MMELTEFYVLKTKLPAEEEGLKSRTFSSSSVELNIRAIGLKTSVIVCFLEWHAPCVSRCVCLFVSVSVSLCIFRRRDPVKYKYIHSLAPKAGARL